MSLGVEADERQAQPVPQRRGLPMEISRLLFGSILSAITVTVAVVAVLISEGSRPAPAGGWLAAVLLVITVNLAVLGWTTVVIVLARDHVIRRISEVSGGVRSHVDEMSPALRDMLAVLRRDLDDDLKQQLKTLEVRLSDLAREFGEQRETDGYVTGMRTALRSGSDAQVHSLHRVPPAG